MAVANKIFSDGKRVLQKRNSAQQVVFNDADIVVDMGANSVSTPKLCGFKFDKIISEIVLHYNSGTNKEKYLKFTNTDSFTKIIDSNVDGNGNDNTTSNLSSIVNNSIFLPVEEKKTITKITSIGQNSNSASGIITFTSGWDSLKEIDFMLNATMGTFVGLELLPSLKILKYKSFLTSTFTDFTRSSVKYLSLILAPIFSVSKLPANLHFLMYDSYGNAQEMDLSTYFTGFRKGIWLKNGKTLSYSGGAIFPSDYFDDADFFIDAILYQASGVVNKLTGDQLSKFIVDFANQVKSCTIKNKIIRVIGSTPNTSYTDNSQPIYKTYTDALNYITNVLKITVTFT